MGIITMKEKDIEIRRRFMRVVMFVGVALMIIGLALFFMSAHFGTIMRDYTVKNSKEYSMIDVTGIEIDNGGNVYCLSNYWSAVNVYSSMGEFLYSLSVPEYQNGQCQIYIYNDSLNVIDKCSNIYYYNNGDFQGRAEKSSDGSGINVYDKNNILQYTATYPNDNLYIPRLVENNFLYVEEPNGYDEEDRDGYLLKYQNGTLISREPESHYPVFEYANNIAEDEDGNIYEITGLIPKLVKTSANTERTMIAADSFFEWVTHESFACLFIAIIGIVIIIIFSNGQVKLGIG